MTNYTPISLGYSCYPAMYISGLGVTDRRFYERHVFDWIGTPMWAICKFMQTDFANFLDRDLLIWRNHSISGEEFYVTNSKYNLTFAHDFHSLEIPDLYFKGVCEKYKRRIERFKSVLSSKKKLLFIRLERYRKDIREFPEYEITESETFYLKQFSQMLRDRGVDFKMLYLTNSDPVGYDPETRICSISFLPRSYKNKLNNWEIRDIIKANFDFIKASLQEQA